MLSEFDNRSLLTTLARNEELLAQVYLSQQDITDTPSQVADYFQKRGWLVKVSGQEEQQK